MKCPNCKKFSVSEKSYNGVNFDMCESCKGFWFDKGELADLIDVALKDLAIPKDAEKSSRYCPKCDGGELYTFKYPQTYCYVDMCSKCHGVWLDPKELEEIKTVRTALKKEGALEESQPVEGVKGSILNFVNSAISSLTKTDQW